MAAITVLAGCGEGEKVQVPTPETIAGVWVQQCQTKVEETTSCTAQSGMAFRFEFWADGRFSKTMNGFDPCTTTSWKLSGSALELECSGGGMTLRERWEARLVGGRLVLWDDEFGGRVLVRPGTKPTG